MTDPNNPNSNVVLALAKYIPVAAVIVTVALGWSDFKASLETERQLRVEAQRGIMDRLQSLTTYQDRQDTRMRNLEENSARSDERFTMILTLMSELKAQVGIIAQQQNEKR